MEGFETAETVKLYEETEILIFTAPLFIASKLVAFFNRGKGDMRTSSDFKDIVFVLDARENLLQEIEASSYQIREYLKKSFAKLLKNKHIDEGIACHLDFYGNTESLQKIKNIMTMIIKK